MQHVEAFPAPGSARFEGLVVTVLNVEHGWKPSSTGTKPEDGKEFLTVEVRFDNPTSESKYHHVASFRAAAGDGTQWGSSIIRTPNIIGGQIPPGSLVRGWMTFQVPVGAQVKQLIWQPGGNKTLVIGL